MRNTISRTLFYLIITLFICQSLRAQVSYSFTLDTIISRNFGYTTYDLRVSDANAEGSSKLEFPLDVFLVGAQLSFNIEMPTLDNSLAKDLCFVLAAYTNINDPYSVMKDHDWIEPAGVPKLKFSYTESDAEMFLLIIDSRIYKKLINFGIFDFFIIGGYSFNYISQVINGYEGWQINQNWDISDISGTEKALEYEIYYHLPMAGIQLTASISPQLSIGWELYGIFVIVYDRDDHILRNKLSTALGVGYGIDSKLEANLSFDISNSLAFCLGLEIKFLYLFAPTKQKQEWYGDDPATPAVDDTGTVINDIIHDITNTQFNLGINMGLSYTF